MLDTTKVLLEDYNAEFKGYLSFIKNNDWISDIGLNKDGNYESVTLKTEVSIIKTVISGTNRFIEDVGDDYNLKPVQELLKLVGDIIREHINKLQEYKRLKPLSADSGEADVEFHAEIFDYIVKAKAGLVKLDLGDNQKSPEIFYGNEKAPLLMREFLCEVVPHVKEKTEALGINFGAPIINPATHNEMFINLKESDVPKWDHTKHYYDQEKSTIEFWEEERRKCRNGVNLGGYQLSGWLYWHINHFKLAFGSGLDKKIGNPYFRDNEYFFDQMITKARENGRVGLMAYGSRRWSKTVIATSFITQHLYTIPKCQGTIMGFSKEPDLKALLDYIGDHFESVNPALRLPLNTLDFTSGVTIGLKGKKAQNKYDYSKLAIMNLDGGTSKLASQGGAGGTPDVFVMDEIGKGDPREIWMAARSSFADGDSNKFRCVPILTGTPNEETLSQGAEEMLKDPDAFGLLPMDWDSLDAIVPDPELITWRREKFGIFLPGQMSLEGPPKIETTLGNFLKKPSNHPTHNIKFYVTDWISNNEFYKNEREAKKNNKIVLSNFTKFHPLTVEDCYATSNDNIFPSIECKKRMELVKSEGLSGQTYELVKSAGIISAEMVDKPIITDYPFKGGIFEAPIVMVENPLLDGLTPPLGLYTMGVDDIKFSGGSNSSDSVFSATVFKRGYEGGEWANRFVAWYDTRPNDRRKAYEQAYRLMKIFNARVYYENNDTGFFEYIQKEYPQDVSIHFAESFEVAREYNLNHSAGRKYGWMATAQNIYRLTQSLVRYAKSEDNVIGEEQNLLGVDLINHPMLLEEMYRYKPKQNADRLRSAGLALILAEYYDRVYGFMKKRSVSEEVKKKRQDKLKKFETYNGLSDVSDLTIW